MPNSDAPTPKPADSDNKVLNLPDDYEEEVLDASGAKVRRKGVYLLPNLLTTIAMFAGFYAIISAMNGNFANAGFAIIAAQFMDGFDGRVARMTNTTSAFGVQYDSLSDMVSFGLAPALVVFSWGLEPLGKFGWAAAFVFAACAALRLARFNTQVGSVDKKYFIGLASPPSAAVLATAVWTWHDSVPTREVSILMAIITITLGVLMVSNVRYTSFKDLNLRGRVPFVVMAAALLIFAIVVIDPPRVLLLMACTYCLSGPVLALLNRRRAVTTQPVASAATSVPQAKKKLDPEPAKTNNSRPSQAGGGSEAGSEHPPEKNS